MLRNGSQNMNMHIKNTQRRASCLCNGATNFSQFSQLEMQ